MQDASTLATAHYPETLDRIFVSVQLLLSSSTVLISSQIIGAPSFFPTVWGWIKKWFDPITTSKIFILSHHEVLPTLESFMDIENIPKKYGGKLDFECGKLPVLDSQVRDCLSIMGGPNAERLFLTAPVRWMDETDEGEMTALGVGSVDGHQRKEPVATLHSLAVRIATNSSRNYPRSQGTETVGAPLSRPSTHHNQATTPLHPFSNGQATPSSLSTTSSIQPASNMNLGTVPLHSQAIPPGGVSQHPIQNGYLPPSINLPARPAQVERMETQYLTPHSDPSEIKRLE